MSAYFDEKEIRSPEARQEALNAGLTEMVQRGYERSSRVRQIFDKAGLTPQDVTTVEDLQKLSVISREQVVSWEAEDPPYGGWCDRDMKIDRIFISPGPVYEPHLTEKSLWSRGYCAAGFRAGDIVLNTFSYHMVAAGLTFHEGLRAVGATVVPSGTSSTDNQVQLIRDLAVTGYTGTPSFLMAIIAKAEEQGYLFREDFHLTRASFVAEPLQPSLRDRFEHEYGIDTYQMYGATEVGDIAYECREKKGWHTVEDLIVEIVDPVTGLQVPTGALGEVVVTRLNDIFFLFRFGTGDLSRFVEDPCPCGRTAVRMDGIAGRVGDAVKVRGMFIAPSQLMKVRERYPGLNFQVVITREAYRDRLTVFVEAPEAGEVWLDEFSRCFRGICTVAIDELRAASPGTLNEEGPLMVDKRSWE